MLRCRIPCRSFGEVLAQSEYNATVGKYVKV
jgi:hypothetical protein